MFYVGFRDIDHAQIGIARSRDGISHWQRSNGNPIISPTTDGWDADACYKPFAAVSRRRCQIKLWMPRHNVSQYGKAGANWPGS